MSIFSKPNKPLLAAEEAESVVQAIRDTEKRTSGELRVYIESFCSFVDAADRAWEVFSELQMHQTQERNAVLVYLALKDRQAAIVGDEGIHQKVGKEEYWKAELDTLRRFCAEGKVAEGLVTVVKEIGSALVQHFPAVQGDDKNEIPDDIVFGH